MTSRATLRDGTIPSWADLGSLREAAAHEGSQPLRGRRCGDRCLRCCRGALGFPLGALGGEKSVVFMEEKYTLFNLAVVEIERFF